MQDLFNSAINHLKQLVSFDTSNPPRAISESGLLDYLESIAGHNLSITDHGNGSFNCLIQQGNPKHLINVHLDTCLLYTSPSPRDQRGSGMPASA